MTTTPLALRLAVLSALIVAVAGLAACSSAPSDHPSGSMTLEQMQAAPPMAPVSSVPDVVTDAITESDPRRPIYASWPDIGDASALTAHLAQTTAHDVADFKRDDPVYPNASVAPEFAGSWDFAGVGATVVGVRLTQYRFAGASGATSTKTSWIDTSTGQVAASNQLFQGHQACTKVIDSVVARARTSGINPNPAGMRADDLLTSVTFTSAGGMVVTLDQGAITSYSRGVLSISVPVNKSLLSPLGKKVQAEIVAARPFGSGSNAPGLTSASVRPPSRTAPTDTTPATGHPVPTGHPSTKPDCATQRCVALTFDDGPGPLTAQVLEALQQADAAATFFVVGANASASPDLVGQLCAAGMSVGSEGWDHRDLTRLDDTEIAQQVQQSAAAITTACGTAPALLRPPYGAYDDQVRAAVGLPLVTWSVDSQDWNLQDADAIVNRVFDDVDAGAIVELHDNEQATLDAVPALVSGLRARGYTLVTVAAFGLAVVALVVIERRLETRGDRAKVSCANCEKLIHASAPACPFCNAPVKAPRAVGLLGQSRNTPADIASLPYRLVAVKRCPVCATRLKRRSVKQTCEACGHRLMDDPAFARSYIASVDRRVPLVLAACALLGLIPVLGVIPGVIYYRLAIVAPFRRYIPAGRGFLLRWGVRLAVVVLVAFQWVPVAGGLALPSMALINYTAYRAAYRKLALAP